jgi:DNA-binding transcriptional MerR regulator
MEKAPDAFRTISEVAEWLDTPTYVLRFWESRFPQIKPVKRAGGRRYYRKEDMLLLGGIKKLLHFEGHTIKGVQNLIKEEGAKSVAEVSPSLDEKVVSPVSDDQDVSKTLANLAAAEEKKARQQRRRERKANQDAKADTPPVETTKTAETTPEPVSETKPEPAIETQTAQITPKVTVTVHKKPKTEKSATDSTDTKEWVPPVTIVPDSPIPIVVPTDSLLPGPFGIKSARSYEADDLQQIEMLYYSLKMVRNNMKRAHAER